MKLGIEVFLGDQKKQDSLKGQRVALVAHPASVNHHLEHTLFLLKNQTSLALSAAFGPQHGMRGEKQDNMIESEEYLDPELGIPVFSLYGEVRKPTKKMMQSFDVLLFDLQDVGTRVYTFLTTLFYLMDACEKEQKKLIVLDRPNPAGRAVEGSLLEEAYQSFVGAAPMPMRHGLTLGEAGSWYYALKKMSFPFEVICMEGYRPDEGSFLGWPHFDLPWVNPSPNIPTLWTTWIYPGTVLLEGTTLSEGRGTTIPLNLVGAKTFDSKKLLKRMKQLAPQWLEGCHLRPLFFEPTFHKYQGSLCEGFQFHVDDHRLHKNQFSPYRLISLILKCVHESKSTENLWNPGPYEYVENHLPIDVISGSSKLRHWVESSSETIGHWDDFLKTDEEQWLKIGQPFLLY